MARALRQAFKVELLPNFDQKRQWKKIHDDARSVESSVLLELESQMRSLGFLVAKNLFLEGTCGAEDRGDLDDLSLSYVREWAYDGFSPHAGRGKRSNIPIRLKADDVLFSVSDNVVRIPYLGAVRHRPNKLIVPSGGQDSEEKQWLLANVQSMFIREIGYALCLVVNTSDAEPEGNFLKKGKSRGKSRRRASKWLE